MAALTGRSAAECAQRWAQLHEPAGAPIRAAAEARWTTAEVRRLASAVAACGGDWVAVAAAARAGFSAAECRSPLPAANSKR